VGTGWDLIQRVIDFCRPPEQGHPAHAADVASSCPNGLAASPATAFFVELGLEVDGETSVQGPSVDHCIGLDDVRADIVMVKAPDGQCSELGGGAERT
jgi:hypothetical protein